jgi:hypothetical protein
MKVLLCRVRTSECLKWLWYLEAAAPLSLQMARLMLTPGLPCTCGNSKKVNCCMGGGLGARLSDHHSLLRLHLVWCYEYRRWYLIASCEANGKWFQMLSVGYECVDIRKWTIVLAPCWELGTPCHLWAPVDLYELHVWCFFCPCITSSAVITSCSRLDQIWVSACCEQVSTWLTG